MRMKIFVVVYILEADELFSSNVHDGLETMGSNIFSIDVHGHKVHPYFSTVIGISLTKNVTFFSPWHS